MTYVKPATQSAYGKEERWLKFEAGWEKPEDEIGDCPGVDNTKIPSWAEPCYIMVKGYGEAVIGPDGYIYTWMRTPKYYKILRWRWVD